jgi:hypothetical protein
MKQTRDGLIAVAAVFQDQAFDLNQMTDIGNIGFFAPLP